MTESANRSSRGVDAGAALRSFVKNNGSFVVFLLLTVIALAFVPNFGSLENLAIVLKQAAIPMIACLGMTMVLMTGGIDLSLGYIVGFASITAGLMVKIWNFPVIVSVLVTLAAGALIGLANGAVIQYMKVPAFIATLGSGYIIYGASQLISAGNVISRLPAPFLAVGRTDILGLPSSVFIAAAVLLIGWFLIHKSTFGRSLSAFGYNRDAAALSGIPTARINVAVYVASGLLAALAGMLLTIRVNCAQPNMGGGTYTFEVITAAIVGGTSLFGGVGSVTGSIFGVLAIKVIENCINLTGVSFHLYLAVQGLIILGMIVFEKVKNRAL